MLAFLTLNHQEIISLQLHQLQSSNIRNMQFLTSYEYHTTHNLCVYHTTDYQDILLTTIMPVLYLYSLLDLTPPSFFHIPLLLSADGRRLSKRDRDCDMEYYRSHTSPEELIGYIMHLCSFTKENVPLSLKEALTLFSWEKLPKEDITLNLK